MEKKQIVYTINGAAASAFSRMIASKTFWVIAVFTLTAADRWNRGEISSSDFFQMIQIGVIGILIRAAMARAELAANAANPALHDIAAVSRDRRLSTEAAGVIGCFVVAGALLGLTACSASRLINPVSGTGNLMATPSRPFPGSTQCISRVCATPPVSYPA